MKSAKQDRPTLLPQRPEAGGARSPMQLRALACCVGYAALAVLSGCGGGSSSPSQPAASLNLTVAPTTITVGQSATLTWSSNAGTTCTASGDWSGSQAATGTQTVMPTAAGTLNYKMSCAGGAYAASPMQTATLTVNPATAYSQTNLVSDGTTVARVTDSKLVDPWGLASAPTGPMWVANTGTQSSKSYDGTGLKQLQEVAIPPSSTGPANPTGLTYNGTSDFVIAKGAASAPAQFLFSGEGGAISGWAAAVDNLNAVTAYDDGTGGAVYKGLALANNGTANFLYATDFHNGKVDVFDGNFAKVTTSGFTDPTLPAGYAPYGVQALTVGSTVSIIVTYAEQDTAKVDSVSGAGLGLVDVFDTNGKLLQHLVPVGRALNAPWGIALAPAGFGSLANTLLVGNFGDGLINAYDPKTGAFVGSVNDSAGKPLTNPGLWGIMFGNGAFNQPATTLFFSAGTFAETGGLYGRIDVGATAPDTIAPTVTLNNAAGTVSGIVTLAATASDNIGVASVKFYAGTMLVGTATSAPFSVQWDTTTMANGGVSLTALAADPAGNTTLSAAVSVTVSNTAPAPTTLAQLQSSIFTPRCSSCHDGNGTTLPGSMDLSTQSNSYAALVNVASMEVPSLQRVKPGDPGNSYLIQKLNGTQSSGNRMPDGGPYLDQATINTVQSWIQAGAGP